MIRINLKIYIFFYFSDETIDTNTNNSYDRKRRRKYGEFARVSWQEAHSFDMYAISIFVRVTIRTVPLDVLVVNNYYCKIREAVRVRN